MQGTLTIGVMAALTITLSLAASVVGAATITYTVSGVEGGLFGEPTGSSFTGGLDLDANASRVETTWGPGGMGIYSMYSSPLQQVWGTFGDWTFSGIADVYVSDGPEYWSAEQDNVAPDYWIVRADVSGPAVNGLTPTHLNLFYYTQPGQVFGSNPFPPLDPLWSVNEQDLQFNLSFSDAEGPAGYIGGRLFILQSIPEPSTALLLVMALGVLAAQRARNTCGVNRPTAL